MLLCSKLRLMNCELKKLNLAIFKKLEKGIVCCWRANKYCKKKSPDLIMVRKMEKGIFRTFCIIPISGKYCSDAVDIVPIIGYTIV